MKRIIALPFFLLYSLFIVAQNSALSFNGNDEFLSVAHDDSYNIGDGFTMEAWILASEWKSTSWAGSIICKDNQGPNRGFAFRCGDGGVLSFTMAVDGNWPEVLTGKIMNTNQWHHVAVVINNGTMKLYIDGQESGSTAYSGAPTDAPDLSVSIGASTGFGGRNFSGVIDEVRIWTDARTQAEIEDNMTVDLPGTEPNLVGYYPMNEGMGTTTGDISNTGGTAEFNAMDETNWVEGYKLPDFDIAVQDVYGVDVVNMINRPVKIQTAIQNNGTMELSNIDFSVYVDGELAFMENIPATLAPRELLNYQFQTPIDLTNSSNPSIMVEANYADDQNSLNNAETLDVVTGDSDRIIISNNEQHNFGSAGQLNVKQLTLPGDMHKYEQVLMHLSLSCPNTGCDPWDQPAFIEAWVDGERYELARFITPYGISCGNWIVDITDFKNILNGQVQFNNYIQVWGTSGWLLEAEIELVDNNANHEFTKITPLWRKNYHVYGDPNISHDLDEVSVDIAANTVNSLVRMTITGHGQGNTNNAAEFFNVTHSLEVNGGPFANHNVWKSDCADNACDDQAGSWLFPRTGWCPGQEVQPFHFNTTSQTTAGASTTFDYVLQDYTNLLNTGYNGGSHTEPHYRLHGYLVEFAAEAYEAYRNLFAESVEGTFNGNVLQTAKVKIGNDGFEDLNGYTVNIFHNSELVATETYTETIAKDASVEKDITVNANVNTTTQNVIFAEVIATDDDNPGDNIVKQDGSTNTNDILAVHNFELFPNPTSNGSVYFNYDDFWRGSLLKIYDANGILLKAFEVTDNDEFLKLTATGMYWYTLSHPQGQQASGKLVFSN